MIALPGHRPVVLLRPAVHPERRASLNSGGIVKKIPTLYQRDPADRRRVTDQVTPVRDYPAVGW